MSLSAKNLVKNCMYSLAWFSAKLRVMCQEGCDKSDVSNMLNKGNWPYLLDFCILDNKKRIMGLFGHKCRPP